MRVGIVGAGSIGMHLAGQLAFAGKEVTLLCRTKEQAELLRNKGLTYIHLDKTESKAVIDALSITDLWPPLDWVFITTKQTHIEEIIPLLKSHPKPANGYVCFQNGLGHDERMLQCFPDIPLLLAVTTEGAYRESYGVIRHTGWGTTWIGPALTTSQTIEKLNQFVEFFEGCQLEVAAEDKIYQRIWRKLIVNCCINPLTAIFQVNNGALLNSPSALDLMEQLFLEANQMAQLEGIEIEADFMEEVLAVCRNTYHNRSSMLQDVEAGRVTEIEYINGAIARIANRWGRSVPYHSSVIRMVQAKQEF